MSEYEDKPRSMLPSNIETDMTSKELDMVNQYMEDGLPGIGTVTSDIIAQMLDAYLGGKSYHQLTYILGLKREMVLYLAHKFKWFELKKDMLEQTELRGRRQAVQFRMMNQDFLGQVVDYFKSTIGKDMDAYWASGSRVAKIDLKALEKYLKTVEILDKLYGERRDSRSPAVGLNLGEGGINIKKLGNNEVEITPKNKEKTVGEMLEELANYRRETESKNGKRKHETSKGESDES